MRGLTDEEYSIMLRASAPEIVAIDDGELATTAHLLGSGRLVRTATSPTTIVPSPLGRIALALWPANRVQR